MDIEVTLNLPESLVEKTRRLCDDNQQEVEQFLVQAIELMLPMIEDIPDQMFPQPVSTLSNEDVLRLADSKMDEKQNLRLGELQEMGKADGLSVDERYELLALLRIYQAGQFRKSAALAEAIRRGLKEPLAA